MSDLKEKISCLNCIYLSKRPGIGAYFIFTCNYWGLVSKRVLPQYVVASSIGTKCPFFKEKEKKQSQNENDDPESDDNLNIIV